MKSLTTKQVIVRIVIIISLAEFVIMLFLAVIPFEVSVYSEATIDIALLAFLSIPLIYFWVIRPFVTARDQALAQISNLAHTDPLTKLPNRRLLSKHLEMLIAGTVRHKLHGAVLLMDLDGFKLINDAHGHDAGDEVLIEIARRIRSITRSEDVAARLGGDEFIILIHHLDADIQKVQDIALQVAEKLIDLVSKPINYKGTILNVGASIGIRLLGSEKVDIDTVIREADIAMYNAKQAGKGCAVFFKT